MAVKMAYLGSAFFSTKKVFAIAGDECRFTTLSIFMGVNRCVFFQKLPSRSEARDHDFRFRRLYLSSNIFY